MKPAELFELPKPPMMHVFDAGEKDGFPICRMHCENCEEETDWLLFGNIEAAKRGIPCFNCASSPKP